MPSHNWESEYGNDAEVIILDPTDGVGGPIRRRPQEEQPKLRRAQRDAERKDEMRQRVEEYAMNNEIEIRPPDEEDDDRASADCN